MVRSSDEFYVYFVFIGTGNHTYATRNNRVGGSCRGTYGTYKLRLKVKVCALNDASCNLCETCSCYTKGKGITIKHFGVRQ